MPTKDAAFSANTQPAPATATMNPPIAGPIARATFMFSPLSAAACGRSPRSTRSGWIACHSRAGHRVTAAEGEGESQDQRRRRGIDEGRDRQRRRGQEHRQLAPSSSRRRSTRSAERRQAAPAARSADSRRSAPTTPAAGRCRSAATARRRFASKCPFEANCAIHSARKIGKKRSGSHADAGAGDGAERVLPFSPGMAMPLPSHPRYSSGSPSRPATSHGQVQQSSGIVPQDRAGEFGMRPRRATVATGSRHLVRMGDRCPAARGPVVVNQAPQQGVGKHRGVVVKPLSVGAGRGAVVWRRPCVPTHVESATKCRQAAAAVRQTHHGIVALQDSLKTTGPPQCRLHRIADQLSHARPLGVGPSDAAGVDRTRSVSACDELPEVLVDWPNRGLATTAVPIANPAIPRSSTQRSPRTPHRPPSATCPAPAADPVRPQT